MAQDVKKSFVYYKKKYAGTVMTSSVSFTKLTALTMEGVEVDSTTQPVYEGGYVYQEFTAAYEDDSFDFTYERKPKPPEIQQFGWV